MNRFDHCSCSPMARQGVAFGPVMGIVATVASVGMSILGSAQQAQGQQQAAEIARTNARIEADQAERAAVAKEEEAREQRAAALDEQAKAQRNAIEEDRQGKLLAGRAMTVMAKSGASPDYSIFSGLLGEGEYAAEMANYEGEQKARTMRQGANISDYEAASSRATGKAVLARGEQVAKAYSSAADATLIGGIGKGVISLASKYGGDSWGQASYGNAASVAGATAGSMFGGIW